MQNQTASVQSAKPQEPRSRRRVAASFNPGLEVIRGDSGGAPDVSAGLAGESWPTVPSKRLDFHAAKPGSKGSPRRGRLAKGEDPERSGALDPCIVPRLFLAAAGFWVLAEACFHMWRLRSLVALGCPKPDAGQKRAQCAM